jgi:UDP-glucose 4-epimerase
MNGTPLRDYIHVNEVCHAIKESLSIHFQYDTIHNLVTGSGYSVLQMVDFFKEVNNCDFKVNILPSCR